MNAVQVLKAARAAGVGVAIDGDKLVLRAATPPPPAVIDLLSRYKAEIVALLRPADDGWSVEDWHVFFDERAGIAEFDGGLPRAEAEAQAFACCVGEWLNQEGVARLLSQQGIRSVAANPLKNSFCRFGRFGRTFSELERRCPEHVDLDSWRQTVEDARWFLSKWGEQAEALDWSAADLFGLAPVPEKPAANYRRLSRYDQTGLLWLLRGRPVVALTDTTAAIQCPTGAIVTYRRHDKPALGPLGDSLEDFA
jgi:hypothetical protein